MLLFGRRNRSTNVLVAAAMLTGGTCVSGASRAAEPPPTAKTTDRIVPVRIASGVSGHIHPAVCKTLSGAIIVIFGQSDFRDLRVTRSLDGGKTWEASTEFPHTVGKTLYPGSLTTLSDGRVLHAWNRWREPTERNEPRYVEYSLSNDDGRTWSEPVALPTNPKVTSVVRHPIVELGYNRWLFSLSDGVFVHDARTKETTRFDDGHTEPPIERPTCVPLVRTPANTFITGRGKRSTDAGKTWQTIEGFPNVWEQGWRHEMKALGNGWIVASEILGPGFGGERIRYVISRDDGRTWQPSLEYYNPGRAINGRACPRTVELDGGDLGVVLYDIDKDQPGGPGLFFLRFPLANLNEK